MRLRMGLAAVLAGVLVAAVPAAAHDPTVTEYQTGLTVNSSPWGITAGPDDSLWFPQNAMTGLASISADSFDILELTAPLPLAGDTRGIAAGPDGNLWVTQTGGSGTIARVTPLGAVTEWPADPAASYPVDITAGPDGNLWFVSQSPEFVGRVTPDGTVTRFDTGITPNSDLSSITAGPDGALWFTGSADPGRIGRITTAGVVSEFTTGLTPNMAPSDITAGPDGNLWFTENADPGAIGRITPEGAITEFTAGLTPDAAPLSIAEGGDGSLWFTESADPGSIGRIATDGTITEHRDGLTDNMSPWQITQGPDGNMWFTGNADPGMVARITVPPGIEDSKAQTVHESALKLKAKIRPNAQDTYFYFQYGRGEDMAGQTETAYAGAGWDTSTFHVDLGGLADGTEYYFRLVATNDSGTTLGPIGKVATKVMPPSAEKGEETGTEKKPEFARSVVAEAQRGTIRYRPPGARRWTRLSADEEIPVGAMVDSRGGSVALTTVSSSGASQSGRFGGGVFSVHQPRRALGRVDLRLRGGDFSRCRRPRRAGARRSATAGASGTRRVRRLWGRDHRGRFRTYGRHSHATVRGTRWLTVDRCDGTLTQVTEGSVVVRDPRRRLTLVVRDGDHYLARRPRR